MSSSQLLLAELISHYFDLVPSYQKNNRTLSCAPNAVITRTSSVLGCHQNAFIRDKIGRTDHQKSPLEEIHKTFEFLGLVHNLLLYCQSENLPFYILRKLGGSEMRCWRLTCWHRPVLRCQLESSPPAGFKTIPRVPKHRSRPGICPRSQRRLNCTTPLLSKVSTFTISTSQLPHGILFKRIPRLQS